MLLGAHMPMYFNNPDTFYTFYKSISIQRASGVVLIVLVDLFVSPCVPPCRVPCRSLRDISSATCERAPCGPAALRPTTPNRPAEVHRSARPHREEEEVRNVQREGERTARHRTGDTNSGRTPERQTAPTRALEGGRATATARLHTHTHRIRIVLRHAHRLLCSCARVDYLPSPPPLSPPSSLSMSSPAATGKQSCPTCAFSWIRTAANADKKECPK
jgi:hypothetical protein